MLSQIIPVYDQKRLFPFMESRVSYPHGVYNCGIGINGSSRLGIVRSCTMNARHRLGWKAMRSQPYGSELHLIHFNEEWEPRDSQPIRCNEIIHDVRINNVASGVTGTGCRKLNNTFSTSFEPVNVTVENYTLKARQIPLPFTNMKLPQKNWIRIDAEHYDMGHTDQLGGRAVMRVKPDGHIRYQVCERHPDKLRGGTNYVKTDHGLLACMHTVDDMGDGVRSYHGVFVLAEPEYPFLIVRKSRPVKFGSNSMSNMIQFPIGLLWDGPKLMISYGLSDADNVIGEIKLEDVLNLMS